MTRTALTTALLAALAFVCLPLRADDNAFTRRLEEAVGQITEHWRKLVDEDPSSVMAQNLASLLSEIGSHLLLQNEHLEEKKMPEEERIPILRQTYLQKMRRIHEIEPDSNSTASYNERFQSLTFFHYDSTGFPTIVNLGGFFSSKLQSLLKIQESIDKDPAARELKAALRELREKWWGFLETHQSEVSHILNREIVRSSPGRLSPPPPTPLEEATTRGLDSLLGNVRYGLSKLDVELAEQEAPREERAKKLRSHFFEIIQEVEYLGLKVQVEGKVVKIPFRDANGPILDSTGAPIAFEFPPKLMAALNMQAPTQGNAKRLQLLMGGGAALLLLVLAGVFLVMKRNPAKEADRSAETES